MLENLYGPVDAVDGDFAGEDLLLAAVGADDELAVGVHVDGCAAACAAARQIEGDMAAQVDAGRLVLVPEGTTPPLTRAQGRRWRICCPSWKPAEIPRIDPSRRTL